MKPPRDYEIRLLCPKCRRAMNVMRCQADPPKAAEVRIQCPECNAGDFDSPVYFDANGKQVPWCDDTQ